MTDTRGGEAMGILRVIGGMLAGYAVGAGLGYAAVAALAGNTHDKAVETATTAFLVTGPLGAVIGLVAALLLRRRG